MRNSRVVAIGIAALLVGMVSGCTVVETFVSVGDEAVLSSELDALSSDLAAIPGIDSVDVDLAIQGDLSFKVGVVASATELTEAAAQDVFARVTETYSSDRFLGQSGLAFALEPSTPPPSTPQPSTPPPSTPQSSTPQPSSIWVSDWLTFPTEVIPREISYIYDVQEIVGVPLSLSLDAPPDTDVSYLRSIQAPTLPDSIDWPALRGMDDTGAGFASWTFGGVSMSDRIIPTQMEALAARAGPIDGIELSWNGAYNSYDIFFSPVDLEPDADYSALDQWPAVVALVDAARASDKDGTTDFGLFSVSTDGASATVSGSACDQVVSPTKLDLELKDRLEADGVDLTAGYC